MSRIDNTANERQTPADTAVRQENQRVASSARQQADLAHLKVAIVHDWLVGGGAEKVVLELHHMFPDAPIYTSYATQEWRDKLDGKVVTGWLQHFGKLRKFMVIPRIWWFTHIDLSGYDLIISSSGNGEAFAVRKNYHPFWKRFLPLTPKPLPLHINYCHSPTHYYWRHYDTYMQRPGFGVFNPLARLGLKLLVSPLRNWDYKAAQRADIVIANSTHIQADIKRYYGRDSEVIFPPIDTERFAKVSAAKRPYFFVVGRQVAQKRQILAIEACTQLGLPLVVGGNGPEHVALVKAAGPSVTFQTNLDDDSVAEHMAAASAFIFTGEDDFGIAPVEAMAAGTPVIAYKAGGALDYVVPGKTGEFFAEQTAESLKKVLEGFDSRKYNSGDIKNASVAFSIDNFHKRFRDTLLSVIK